MATDIAFVVGCMAVLGSRIPPTLRVLLLTLAIADDIGAILVIAIGYTADLDLAMLAGGGFGIAVVALLSRLGVRSFGIYTAVGAVTWYCFHESGVHATIAGVILGLQTPARSYLDRTALGRFLTEIDEGHVKDAGGVGRVMRVARESVSPLDYLMHALHPWVAFVIMPVFALANAGVKVDPASLTHPLAIAVALGLLLGKPIGILVISWLAVKVRLTTLPEGVTWPVLAAAGFLAGIGFTMAIFIAGLALGGELLDTAKVGILAGSGLAALIGMAALARLLAPQAYPRTPARRLESAEELGQAWTPARSLRATPDPGRASPAARRHPDVDALAGEAAGASSRGPDRHDDTHGHGSALPGPALRCRGASVRPARPPLRARVAAPARAPWMRAGSSPSPAIGRPTRAGP
jgi:NhaA family Na+:H+ antiporter